MQKDWDIFVAATDFRDERAKLIDRLLSLATAEFLVID